MSGGHIRAAICKPDHLGDFVMALPAMRRLREMGYQLTLFIASANMALARHLMPEAELVALDMPYLKRDMPNESWGDVYRALGRLREFDMVFFLRRDAFLRPESFAQWTDYAFFIEDRPDRHQTILEHQAVSQVCGDYDIEEFFFGDRDVSFPSEPDRVALAIGAGFPHKKWSPLAWARLAHILRDRGLQVEILSGPGEVDEARLIARAAGIDDKKSVFVGRSDFSAFEDWLDTIDVVIAVDGGSAHLCSMRKPILSIFGPSPFLRFAPTGSSNRLVTRALSCSPCVGFHVNTLNACLSRECLYNLWPAEVAEALATPNIVAGQQIALSGSRGTKVHFGVSLASSPGQ